MNSKSTLRIETLDNGLTVVLNEMHSAPLISNWVWYRVGSRNEKDGIRGISHWVEHMQFKGTEKFPAEALEKAIARCGGMWNAFTYKDYTAFFEMMPSSYLDLAIELEADRMVNARYPLDEVESERTVILSELEGDENDPTEKLEREMLLSAYQTHPYRHEVIGLREDLLKISRDELYGYYRTFYAPNNAVVCISGDFDTEKTLRKVAEVYRGIPMSALNQEKITPESALPTARTIEVSNPMGVTMMNLTWRSPEGRSEEIYALSIFDGVLSGTSPLSYFGSAAIANHTSRLYQKLVPTGLAVEVGGGFACSVDPSTYSLSVVLNAGGSTEAVCEAVQSEIDSIIENGISQEELQKTVKQYRALMAFTRESVINQGFLPGYASVFSDPEWFERYIPGLEAVRAEDVRKVAEKYFKAENRLTGICRSQEELA